MRPPVTRCIVACLPMALLHAPAHAAEAGACTANHIYPPTSVYDEDAIAAHRQFALPDITYPSGSGVEGYYGLRVTVDVDAAGRVVCYSAERPFVELDPKDINPLRRAVLAQIGRWHYTPFRKDGQPVAAAVYENIYEQQLPDHHVALPAAPLDDFAITLERTACYGTCPAYKVEIHGDGRVTWRGEAYVDVEGEHAYRIPTQDVARLLDSVRSGDLWSMRPDYSAGVTDNPAYTLTIAVGSQKHTIIDYVGPMVGMPKAIRDVENQVDAVAQTGMWIHLTMAGIEHLQAEHFDFHSREGKALLERASSGSHGEVPDRTVLARLVGLVTGAKH